MNIRKTRIEGRRDVMDICIPIVYDFLPPGKGLKLCFSGRLTREGKVRQQFPQGSILSCRVKLGGVRGESTAATNAFMELTRPRRGQHGGYRYGVRR